MLDEQIDKLQGEEMLDREMWDKDSLSASMSLQRIRLLQLGVMSDEILTVLRGRRRRS